MDDEKCPECGGELRARVAPYYAMPASILWNMMRCDGCREKLAEFVTQLMAAEKPTPQPAKRCRWRDEFSPDYAVPAEIQALADAGVIDDVSWHNDCCPSFCSHATDRILWVDHPEMARRELGEVGAKRFSVVDGLTGETCYAASECFHDVSQFLTTCPA